MAYGMFDRLFHYSKIIFRASIFHAKRIEGQRSLSTRKVFVETRSNWEHSKNTCSSTTNPDYHLVMIPQIHAKQHCMISFFSLVRIEPVLFHIPSFISERSPFFTNP